MHLHNMHNYIGGLQHIQDDFSFNTVFLIPVILENGSLQTYHKQQSCKRKHIPQKMLIISTSKHIILSADHGETYNLHLVVILVVYMGKQLVNSYIHIHLQIHKGTIRCSSLGANEQNQKVPVLFKPLTSRSAVLCVVSRCQNLKSFTSTSGANKGWMSLNVALI